MAKKKVNASPIERRVIVVSKKYNIPEKDVKVVKEKVYASK